MAHILGKHTHTLTHTSASRDCAVNMTPVSVALIVTSAGRLVKVGQLLLRWVVTVTVAVLVPARDGLPKSLTVARN